MSLLQEMETHGLADCEDNRRLKMINILGNSLYWQTLVNRGTTDPKQRERTQIAIDKLTQQIGALNDAFRD